MFVLGKISMVSSCGKYAVIKLMDHIDGERRTTQENTPESALTESRYGFKYTGTDSRSEKFVGIDVVRYKELRPNWFVTENELMAKYESAQRDQKVDIHPELLPHAKRIWSERVKKLTNATALIEQEQKPSVMCEGSEAHDHEGVPI